MWPFRGREVRQAGTDGYTERLLQAQSDNASLAMDAGRSAALEACAGLLARSLASARVGGTDMVTPDVLAAVGRALVTSGEALFAIRGMDLIECSTWYWQDGDSRRSTWRCIATAYGPSDSETWNLPSESVLYFEWGHRPSRRDRGAGPGQFASEAARLAGASERSQADEAAGPVAQVLPAPLPTGASGDQKTDFAANIARLIGAKRGGLFVGETGNRGVGIDAAAPSSAWRAARLGPDTPDSFRQVARDAFDRFCAACGVPPSLFHSTADGTSQRESLRRFGLFTLRPLARCIEAELSAKLAAPVTLLFDSYDRDMVSRSQVFAKLAAVEGITAETALRIAGLLEREDA